jgi:hypothetical protein
MRVRILKSFPFYQNGNTRREAVAGHDEDIPDALVDGLSAAGYVEKASLPAMALAVALPNERHRGAPLSVRHIGRGKYDVFSGDERVTHEAMGKEAAEEALAEMKGETNAAQ